MKVTATITVEMEVEKLEYATDVVKNFCQIQNQQVTVNSRLTNWQVVGCCDVVHSPDIFVPVTEPEGTVRWKTYSMQ